MITQLRALAAAVVFAVAGSAASAASYTFNFDDEYRYAAAGETLDFHQGPLTLKVSGEICGSCGATSVKTENPHGLSVGYHWIDAYYGGGHDYAVLEFSHAVSIKSFYANYAGGHDKHQLWAIVDGYEKYLEGGYTNYYNEVASTQTSTKFFLGAVKGKFKLKSLTVHKEVSEVPLPAGALLLLTGLGVLGLRKRKS